MKIFKLVFKNLGSKNFLRSFIFLLIFSLVLPSAGPVHFIKAEEAGGVSQNVLSNYPHMPKAPPISPAEIDWEEDSHSGIDGAFTEDIRDRLGTDSHVVVDENEVSFYGYESKQAVDYAFTQGRFEKTYGNSFILHPSNMDFHSFSETGYLFNGELTGGYYSGYAVVLQCANTEGMQENNPEADNTASLRLYYLEHENFNTDEFVPDKDGNRRLIATYKTGIESEDDTPMRVSVEIDPGTRAFDVYVDGALCTSVAADGVMGEANDTGFGFYCGYYWHFCPVLTRIRFEDVTVDVEVTDAPVEAEVRFLEQGSGTEILPPVKIEGMAEQKYKIEQPQTLDVNGGKWILERNGDGTSVRNDMTKFYYADESRNITELYYRKFVPEDTPEPPTKSASVNGGEWYTWDDETDTTPVSVKENDEIDYRIMVNGQPKRGKAMLAKGNSTSSATATIGFGSEAASLSITKNQIKSVTFVNFDKTYKLNEFETAYQQQWNGETIVEAWDATENDTALNAKLEDKVIAWTTEYGFSGSNQYNLFIGGFGGVRVGEGASLFRYFSLLESLDLTYLSTSSMTSMSYMFSDCENLKSLDLSAFDTSKVTTMQGMFRGCKALLFVDVSNFDTSKVTSMSTMFNSCSMLEKLDLSSFTTEALTNVSSIFNGCSKLAEVHFDRAKFENLNSSSYAFLNAFANCKMFVNPEANLDNFSGKPKPANIIEVPEITDPLLPVPDPSEYVIVQDHLPAGLEIITDPALITGTEGDYDANAVTYKINEQTVTWKIPKAFLPTEVAFKAKVASGAVGDIFENLAHADSQQSNKTYHELTSDYRVTERYVLCDDPAAETDAAQTTLLPSGSSYSIKNQEAKLAGYSYRGYSIGGEGIIEAEAPPNGAVISALGQDETVTLYYGKYGADTAAATVHFLDSGGGKIREPIEEAVAANADYYIPRRYFNNFGTDKDWVYCGYSIGGPSAPAAIGAADYPDFSKPTFEDISGGGNNIYLYFRNEQALTVRFAEDGNESVSLKNEEIYFVSDPSLLHSSVYDPIDFGGRTYTYTDDEIESQTLTLKFSAKYKVTEKFMKKVIEEENGEDVAKWLTLRTDGVTEIAGGGSFERAAAEAEEFGGYGYKGYAFDSTNNAARSGGVNINNIRGDYVLIHMYEALPERTVTFTDGEDEQEFTVTEGETVTPLPPAAKPGSIFGGWNTEEDGGGEDFDPAEPVDADGDYFAQWTLKNYTVKYDMNGATSAAIADKENVRFTDGGLIPAANPEKADYSFTGWHIGQREVFSTDAYGDLVEDDTVSSLTLRAGWEENIIPDDPDDGDPAVEGTYYEVSYHPNGGDGYMPADKVAEGGAYSVRENEFIREGYSFSSWTSGSAITVVYGDVLEDVQSDIELLAQWEEDEEENEPPSASGSKEAEVVIKPGLPAIDSGNLPDVLGDGSETFEEADREAVAKGGTVRVELHVNDVEESAKVKLDAAMTANEHRYEAIQYVDLSVIKTRYDKDGALEFTENLSDLKNIFLDINIPVSERIAAVYRVHGTAGPEALPERSQSGGEYFFFTPGGENGGAVTLHVNRFSAYLLVKENADDGGNNDNGSGNNGSNGNGSGSSGGSNNSGGSSGGNGNNNGRSNNSGGGNSAAQVQPETETFGKEVLLNTEEHFAYMVGFEGGLFAPDKGMTRAEAAQMFYNLLSDKNVSGAENFPDVPRGQWYTKAVETLAALNIISGYTDGGYYPDKNITRAEFAAVAVKFSRAVQKDIGFEDVPDTHWARDYIAAAAGRGFIRGMGNARFEPDREIKRAEAVTIVNIMLGRQPDKAFIDARRSELNKFGDIAGHWAYYGIMEATVAHEYEMGGENERWKLEITH